MRIVGFIIGIMTFAFQGLSAQEIAVKDFKETAEIQIVPTQRVDVNGVICALVRVVVPSNEGVLFQGNVIGETVYKGNEYLVYMSEGSRFLRIHYPNCETLMIDFTQFGYEGLESKRVYELVLTLPIELTQGMLGANNTEASNDLGLLFFNNNDYDRAIHWFELAAKEGNIDAQNNLGLCYVRKRDYNQAIHWFEQAAQAGNVYAQYNLASHYLANQDYEQAVPWLEKAAQQNHVEAQCDLGVHYYNNKDYKNAAFWFQKSANAGNKKAMGMLSVCYRNGWGVVQDISLAEQWAEKASRM